MGARVRIAAPMVTTSRSRALSARIERGERQDLDLTADCPHVNPPAWHAQSHQTHRSHGRVIARSLRRRRVPSASSMRQTGRGAPQLSRRLHRSQQRSYRQISGRAAHLGRSFLLNITDNLALTAYNDPAASPDVMGERWTPVMVAAIHISCAVAGGAEARAVAQPWPPRSSSAIFRMISSMTPWMSR
jgi:hypothetical protein